MSRIVYDVSMLAALLLCSVGAGLQWGVPVGLMVGGAGLASTTLLGVWVGGMR